MRDTNVDASIWGCSDCLVHWGKCKHTWTTLFTVCSNWEACKRPVSVSFPLSSYYRVTGAEVFEPCFYLTENGWNWVKGVCSERQTVCTDEKSASRYHTFSLLLTQPLLSQRELALHIIHKKWALTQNHLYGLHFKNMFFSPCMKVLLSL